MKLLISNDDGVHAPGIRALAEELAILGEPVVIAPDRNRSGASNSLTLSRPIRAHQLENGYYSVEGTPTDCVHLALTGFMDTTFDMVISGLNDGGNLGDDVIYSGTVAAAIEACNLGLPAIALSMVGQRIQHYHTGAVVARDLALKVLKGQLPPKTLLNVNIPDLPLDQIKGYHVTRLGTRHIAAPIIKDHDPRGHAIYWVGPSGPEADAGPGTDFYAVKQGYVSITPLYLDMTCYKIFDNISNWFQSEEKNVETLLKV